MSEAEFYDLFSYLAAALSVASAYIAYKAMRKGLTYSTMRGTEVLLLGVAIGRIFHSVRETLQLGPAMELVEYAFYIVGNIYFIMLANRMRKLPAALEARDVGPKAPPDKR